MEHDAVEAVPMLFEKLLYEPSVLVQLSGHHATQQQLHVNMATPVVQGWPTIKGTSL